MADRSMDVIVNADDLGISPHVNEAIFALIENGLATSSSLIANGPAVEEACREISRYPRCSFGAHLNVTEFQPLTEPEGLGPLLDEQGRFISERVRQVPLDAKLSQAVLEEFCAQIDKLLSLGVEVSHIDSHNYVHNLPRMFPILKRVQKRFSIRCVRLTRNIYGPDERAPFGLRAKKAVYNFLLKHYFRSRTTAGFSGFNLFYECATTKTMKHRSFEVVVHPGSDYYEKEEIELLCSPWRDALPFKVRLISHDEVR